MLGGILKRWLIVFVLFAGICAGGLAHAANNCTDATYYDADSDTCIACPAGYDANTDAGKTSINQCQIHCDAGTYVDINGRNLLNSSFMNNSTYGNVTVNGVTTSRAKILPTENGKTYTLSATLTSTGTYFYYIREVFPGGTTSSPCVSMWNNNGASNTNTTVKKYCTFTTRNNATYLVYFATDVSLNTLTLTDYQMEEGSLATGYQPYNSMLPSGYTPLEYLMTTGGQYIDTGITANPMTEVDMEVSFGKVTSGTYVIIGTRNGTNTTDANVFQWGATNSKIFNRFGSSPTGAAVSADTLYNVHIENGLQTVKSGGSNVSTTTISYNTTMNTAGTLYMFCTHDTTLSSGTTFSTSNGTYIKKLRISDSGRAQRDFVPARRDSDGELGMYDMVTGTFFTNLGTGAFVGGPIIAPACTNVGAGYYSSASTVNYGSGGVRDACPAGTYSTATNATSASTCITCTGATYSTSGSGMCSACPSGYIYDTTSGKTSADQCQIQCNAGTYIPYTQLEYIQTTGTQWIDTGVKGNMNYKYEIDFQQTDLGVYYLWGAWGQTSASGNNMSLVYYTSNLSNRWALRWDYNSNRGVILPVRDSDRHLVRVDNGEVFFDGVSIGTSAGHNSSLIMDYNLFLGTVDRAGTVASTYNSKARFYSYKVYDENDVLVQNLVPARRTGDNVVGMYDTVSGTFFTNAGTGTFTAGPRLGGIGGVCVNVGAGYWIGASVVNFGSIPTVVRNACPIGTYSDVVNATSAAACTDCVGATYNDEPAAVACKACPTGYIHNTTAGKTSIGQCQIHCGAGTYVENTAVGDVYTPLEYIALTGTQYIDTGVVLTDTENIEHVMNIQSDIASGFRTWSGFMNTSGTTPRYGINFYNGKWMIGINITSSDGLSSDTNAHTVKFVTSSGAQTLYDTNGTTVLASGTLGTGNALSGNTLSLYIGARNNSGSPVNYVEGHIGRTYLKKDGVMLYNYIPAQRDSDGVVGMYDTVSGTFFTNAGTGTFTAGPVVAGISGVCTNVGAGYYAAASTVNFGSVGTRNACPAGTTTVGYGHGADSANDCGRTLHVGDNVVYMRKNKETSPSVGIDMGGGDVYYISLSPTNHNMSPVHFWHNGAEYTAYDDSLFYNERSLGN